MKRDDMLHPDISGNKWRKLKYNLLFARAHGFRKILTFGGAYSNHIYAAAAAGKAFRMKTVGIIRGEAEYAGNETLSFAKACGMELFFVSRAKYRERHSEAFHDELREQFGKVFIVPEGGSNEHALQGAKEIVEGIPFPFDYLCTASGTGGTLAGISTGLAEGQQAIGFPVLKNGEFLNNDIRKLIPQSAQRDNWKLETGYHFGGYAKFNMPLIDFINDFKHRTGIPLDPVYTGKMVYGVYDLIKKDHFRPESTIVMLHTGGLQGIRGFNARHGNLIL
ncbi:MAG: pyridoxal-phosphate dependent enzyme [Cytophagales bacterium]|nr:pyridoxal-phosphate dependent enzyme [Cytophagales bacterium]